MAKITLPTIESGFMTNTAFNEAFGAIQSELNNNVLYRNNPSGEPNEMHNDIDMNGFGVYNASFISADKITIDGVDYYEACRAEAERAKLEADRAKWEADRAHDEADRSEEAVNSFVETDPTVPWFVKEITTEDIERWDESGNVADGVIQLNKQVLTTDYTLPPGYNGLSAGPITFTGSVSVPPGAAYYVLDEDMGSGGGSGSVVIDAYTKEEIHALQMEQDIKIDRNESNINNNASNIVELEEEIEALAPSFDRGHWEHDESPTAGSKPATGKYYLTKSDDTLTNDFTNTTNIFFNNIDKEEPANTHTFTDVEIGQYIEMFESIDNSFLLGMVTEINKESGYTVIKVDVVKAEGGPGDVDITTEDKVRVKFFTVSGTVDLDTLMPKSGGTFTGQVKHKKEILIEPTLPNSFVNIKNRYTTNADGTDTGNQANGTGFGINFDLDHGNSGYNQVKWTTRLGDILNISGGTKPSAKFGGKVEFKKPFSDSSNGTGFIVKGAVGDDYSTTTVSEQEGDLLSVYHNSASTDAINYRGKIASDKNITTKEYVDNNANTYSLTSGPVSYRKKGNESLEDNQFGAVGSSVGSTNVILFNKLFLHNSEGEQLVKDYEATNDTWFEVYKNSALILRMQIKKSSWQPSSHNANQIQCSGAYPYPLVGLSENWSNTTNYKIALTGLKKVST